MLVQRVGVIIVSVWAVLFFEIAHAKPRLCRIERIGADTVQGSAALRISVRHSAPDLDAKALRVRRGSLIGFEQIAEARGVKRYRVTVAGHFTKRRRRVRSLVRLRKSFLRRVNKRKRLRGCRSYRLRLKRSARRGRRVPQEGIERDRETKAGPRRPNDTPTTVAPPHGAYPGNPAPYTPNPTPLPTVAVTSVVTPSPRRTVAAPTTTPISRPQPTVSVEPQPTAAPPTVTTPEHYPTVRSTRTPISSPTVEPMQPRVPAATSTPIQEPPEFTPEPSPLPESCGEPDGEKIPGIAVMGGIGGHGSEAFAGSGRNVHTPCSVVYRVTSLEDEGVGTLRECLEARGPRTCVFEIGGEIIAERELRIVDPYVTIAGQTAPAPGIIIRGAGLSIEASEVLVQHLRVRVGDDPQGPNPRSRDGVRIWASRGAISGVVIDHVSVAWALDEGLAIVPDRGPISQVTVSNSIIASGLDMSIHPEADDPGDRGHSKGVLISGSYEVEKLSFYRNVLAHNADRNIRIATPISMEFVNNVVYGWGRGGGAGRTLELTNSVGARHFIDVVGNLYLPGPDTFCPETQYQSDRCTDYGGEGIDGEARRRSMHYLLRVGSGVGGGLQESSRYFLHDNISNTRDSGENNWRVADKRLFYDYHGGELVFPQNRASETVAASGRVAVLPAESAYGEVLATAGARPLERDTIDERTISDVRNRTGRIINCVTDDGSSRCAKNAGGWPRYSAAYRELSFPASAFEDGDGDGYTRLEEWLREFAVALE